MKRSIIITILTCASSLFALSPPPGGFKEKPLEEIWNESKEVVYGKIIELKLDETSEQERQYSVRLRVERCWKGVTEKEKYFSAALAYGDGLGYSYKLGVNYVIFLSKEGEIYYSLYSMPIKIPAGQIEMLFENESSDQDTGDGFKMKNKWKLRQFLNSKDHLTEDSNPEVGVSNEFRLRSLIAHPLR